LVVWKIDRLGQSSIDVLETARHLREPGIHLVITTLGADTSTPASKLEFGFWLRSVNLRGIRSPSRQGRLGSCNGAEAGRGNPGMKDSTAIRKMVTAKDQAYLNKLLETVAE
jgi:hypothetical protein